LGGRLERERVLAQRDDIFFLNISEVELVMRGETCVDLAERIGSRRKEYKTNTMLKPPPVVIGRFDPGEQGRGQSGLSTDSPHPGPLTSDGRGSDVVRLRSSMGDFALSQLAVTRRSADPQKRSSEIPLAHPMGEGRGEGNSGFCQGRGALKVLKGIAVSPGT